MASKKTKVVSGRVPHNVANEMKLHGLTVTECVQIALNSKRNKNDSLMMELKRLYSEEQVLASRIARVNIEIEDLKKQLNINKSDEELKKELFVDDNEKAIQRTLDRYYSIKGSTRLPLDVFINSKEGKRIISTQLSKCDLTEDDFILMLFEKHDKSVQTKLDS